jgi:U4/U6.U5 tri-snRNP-associated protein 1
MADINIEETNKIRVALGMAPLPVPGAAPVFKAARDTDSDSSSEEEEAASTLESRQAQASDNWRKLQEEADAKAKRKSQKEAIKRARDAAQRFAKLEGKGLGEADNETELDTKTWLLRQKKRQKKIEKARLLEKELAEREKAQEGEYTASDLAGVKVGHELAQFDEGGEQILTLKDANIDEEDEDDELENVGLREKEKLAERLELKKKKPLYDPHALNEGETSILAHYDEELHGKRRNRFTLDGQGSTQLNHEMTLENAEGSQRIQMSLDILKDDAPISDYIDPSETKMRKPKKKKSKSTRKRDVDADDIFPAKEWKGNQDAMDVAGADVDAISKKRAFDTTLADDDDLQANLAMQRREALKRRKKTRPEDLARQVRDEAPTTPGVTESIEAIDEEPGLVIDETSEFVDRLQKPVAAERQRRNLSKTTANGVASVGAQSPAADADGDIEMNRSYNEIHEDEAGSSRTSRNVSAVPEGNPTGLDEEITLNQGVGAALSLLTQRGVLKTAASGDLNAIHRERQRFLAEKHRRESEAEKKARQQRERDRQSGRLDRMSAREREEYGRWNNAQREQMESRQMAEIFNREYKPDVQLKYIDDFGRNMSPREAFKHLSHQFHGKGSGKQKTEKRLKKIEAEKSREAMSTLDSSQAVGMNNAMGATAKKNRQAGVRLQ